MNSQYVGNCAYCSTAEKLFLKTSKDDWLAGMKKGYARVSPFPLSPQQVRAWSNSYDVLCEAFGSLPPKYMKQQLIFEYVLPQHNPAKSRDAPDIGVRADVVMLCRDVAVTLEFKDREAPYSHCERQARKYRTRLQRWHTGSVGMSKKAVMVFTKAAELREARYRVVLCSPDQLAEVLREACPEPFRPMPQVGAKRWMTSDWIVKPKYLKE